MRAKEFITEDADNVPHTAKSALNGMVTMPDMDGFYEFYRFMTMTAGEPDYKIPPAGKLRDKPTSLPYTDVEMAMVTKSAGRMGKTVVRLTPKGNQEPKDNHIMSPVASIKRNKHGV
jgi:hypothetical protein